MLKYIVLMIKFDWLRILIKCSIKHKQLNDKEQMIKCFNVGWHEWVFYQKKNSIMNVDAFHGKREKKRINE